MSAAGDPDPAVQAFEQLRSEVMLLRRAVEGLAAQQPEPAPDYTPTLGHLTNGVAEMAERLGVLAEAPYLAFSPETLAAQIQSLIIRARQEALGELHQAIDGLNRATVVMDFATRNVRSQREQWRWLVYAGIGGGVIAVAMWLALSGPAVRALPSGWQIPERMAAATLGERRWDAGARLMRRAEPLAWDRLMFSDELTRRNKVMVQACAARARKGARAVVCAIRVDPDL